MKKIVTYFFICIFSALSAICFINTGPLTERLILVVAYAILSLFLENWLNNILYLIFMKKLKYCCKMLYLYPLVFDFTCKKVYFKFNPLVLLDISSCIDYNKMDYNKKMFNKYLNDYKKTTNTIFLIDCMYILVFLICINFNLYFTLFVIALHAASLFLQSQTLMMQMESPALNLNDESKIKRAMYQYVLLNKETNYSAIFFKIKPIKLSNGNDASILYAFALNSMISGNAFFKKEDLESLYKIFRINKNDEIYYYYYLFKILIAYCYMFDYNSIYDSMLELYLLFLIDQGNYLSDMLYGKYDMFHNDYINLRTKKFNVEMFLKPLDYYNDLKDVKDKMREMVLCLNRKGKF